MQSPWWDRSRHKITVATTRGVTLVAYIAALDVPRHVVEDPARLLVLRRRRMEPRKGARALGPFRQAVLVPRWFRERGGVHCLARDAGVSPASRATGGHPRPKAGELPARGHRRPRRPRPRPPCGVGPWPRRGHDTPGTGRHIGRLRPGRRCPLRTARLCGSRMWSRALRRTSRPRGRTRCRRCARPSPVACPPGQTKGCVGAGTVIRRSAARGCRVRRAGAVRRGAGRRSTRRASPRPNRGRRGR